ncbi:hypothetical protein B0H19DRAFT_965788 [Mycena capillaripes]|nr:hypothetical protein B0H19DRAFT_965788 [Mycena capillaripes]
MHLSRVFSVSLGTIAAAAVDILDTRQPIFLAEETPILNARLETAIWDILKEFRAPGGVVVALVRKTAQRTWQLESTGYGNATSHVDPTSTAPCSRSHLTQLRSSPSVLIFIPTLFPTRPPSTSTALNAPVLTWTDLCGVCACHRQLLI